MTEDLITWLRTQLDDDERVAREAGHRALTWPTNETWWLEGVEHNVIGQEEAFCHPHNVEHIARHDPARVLAEVDVKRRILDWYEATEDRILSPDAWNVIKEVIEVLALPYADRPGYRSEWAP